MDWISTALSLVGPAIDIFGQVSEASDKSAAAGRNAQAYQKEAEYQQFRTGEQLSDLKVTFDQTIAAQRATFAKAGIVVDHNTAKSLALSSERQYLKDRNAIQLEGKFNVERAQMGAQSSLNNQSQINTELTWSIGRTLLSTAKEII